MWRCSSATTVARRRRRPSRCIRSAMTASLHTVVCSAAALAASVARDRRRAGQHASASTADAATIADFKKRVNEYVASTRKLEQTLPTLPDKATPQQMDTHERALAQLMQENRADAKPRDIFTEPMQRIIRRLLRQVFRGASGAQVKKEILEEYTEPVGSR